jgi:arylsulfatase A-like enzyme
VAKYIKEIDKITDRETTFIVTSDHGENLAYPDDNDLLHHKSSMTESLLHVPFEIINPPTGYDDTESGLFSHLQLKQLFKGFENETAPDVFTNRVPAERIGTIKLADLLDIVDRFDLNDNQLTKKHNFLDRCIRCVYEKDVKYEWDSYGNTLKYQIDGESSQEMVDDETQIPQFCKSLFDSSISEVERRKRSEDSKESPDDEAKERLKKLGYL